MRRHTGRRRTALECVLAEFDFDGFETAAAEAVAVAVGEELLLFGGHRDAVALAFEDVTDLAFEGLLAAAAMFRFVLAHIIKIKGPSYRWDPYFLSQNLT